MEATIEQLKAHFGSNSLIGRVKEIDQKKREGRLEAFQVDKGQPWLYPDGRFVNDILFTYSDKTEYKKGNWVLIDDYNFVDELTSSSTTPQLKAHPIRLLAEIEPLLGLLNANGTTTIDRQLAKAIQNVQLVGNKVFILQDCLKKEREEIKKQFATEEDRLHNWRSEIEVGEQGLEHDRQSLHQERLAFTDERNAYYNQREALQKADTVLVERLQFYGLTPETVETGQIQLSDPLIKLLFEQASVYERLKQEKVIELADIEHEYEQWQVTLEAQERGIAEKQSMLLTKEQAVEEHTTELTCWEQDIKKLQESVRSATKPKVEPIRTTPVHTFAGEEAAVSHIKSYIQAKGFYYPERLLENFYTCLKTDYLVILSGISGTGKSKLPQLFAKAIGAEFELIPVRPHWNDDRDLLGFFNARAKRYQSTRFIEFLLRANEDPDRLYIACLDEMNLAPVEYYFAQLLSVMESDDPKLKPPDETLTDMEVSRFEEKAWIKLGRLQGGQANMKGIAFDAVEREKRLWSQALADLKKYQEVAIPPNVKFVGTVNIDHTTHGFSDKVLDRANVIQFERVDLGVKLESAEVAAKGLSYNQFADYRVRKSLSPDQANRLQTFVDKVRQINNILELTGTSIGFRVLDQIQRYMHYIIQSSYFDQAEVAFDFQIKQRILPKVRGMTSKELEQALEELKSLCKVEGYSLSYEKLAGRQGNDREYGGMLQQLENKGYVNYWEIR